MLRTDLPKTIYLKNYQPYPYDISETRLEFSFFEDKTRVRSKLKVSRRERNEADLVLNGEDVKLISVKLNSEELNSADYELTNKTLTISDPGMDFTLEIETEIDPESNTALEGVYKSGGNFCTQCEAEGFRRITFYPDRPDVLSVFTVRLEADKAKYPVLLSNGNLAEEGDLGDGRHYALWHDPFPKPCYLFALVVGDLVHIQDHFTTMTGRDVDLRIYVRKGDEGQCAHAMESLIKSMKWDEEVYGREYQLERFNIVAVSDFNMGAMENTSLNIFNTALVLAHPDTATDTDFQRVESVIGHEYFHNWTGNRVTCRDWFQLSLKEGLTVFRDQEFSADMNSRAVQRIEDVNHLRRSQFVEDASPLAHPIRPDNYIEINNFYTMTVYEKGAEVIRMQHTLLGEETYRKATDLYFDRYDGMAVTCEDFVGCMADASGLDMTGQFFRWYNQAGTPTITATTAYDENAKRFTLTLAQTIPDTAGQTDKKPMVVPVALGLLNDNGDDMDLGDGQTTQLCILKDESASFTFDNIASKPVPSILRNFSAPVKLITDLTDEELRFLQVHDSDGFNRWEAGQTLALRLITDMLDGKVTEVPAAFSQAFGDILAQAAQKDSDKALIAHALTLPDPAVIAQHRAPVDPKAIHDVREKIILSLALAHATLLKETYAAHQDKGPFDKSASAMARRALKNICLRYLSAAGDAQAAQLAYDHYTTATNMTDRVAALSNLSDMVSPMRDQAFEDFYARFKDYPLVIDKWFSLQAMATRESIFEDLAKLRAHKDFNIKNPNRVRSLYAAFAMNNPASFHDVSGKGYQFLGDVVVELNTINPQIASRMLTPLREWRNYTQDRQALMKETLERIAATPKLSDNVFEIVTKTLKS
ncbi:MAG: aminopeptidase N [Pseudobdellovibrionaceae bacterium]